ncbi:hypothetical protein Patl1_16004 [Pistacia atlantica]|uniref:Uncharacterized protein n=1 Tax=Pistacia atlantica TaxID=434234 RepID=A0ACC1B6F8_9ROSI|nr:hypothetical protein Patl1_16004 [Pistacia atlantica]
MYLTSRRPDIRHAVGLISRYMENPTEIHLLATKRMLRRLLKVLHIQQQSPTLIYCDDISAIKLSKIQFYIEGASILMRDTTSCVIYARMVLLIWCFAKAKIRLQIFRLSHSSLLCL